MPQDVTYPGVYVQELSPGTQTPVGVATNIAAFVGRTPKGPVGAPTTAHSWVDYENRFGPLDVGSPLSYQVKAFYDNGGGDAVILRLFRAPEAPAGVTISIGAPGEEPVLVLEIEPGALGNGIRAVIDRIGITPEFAREMGAADPASMFNLTITDSRAGADRIHWLRGLSLDPGDKQLFARDMIASALDFVTVTRTGTTLPDLPLEAEGEGGAESLPLTPADYIGDAATGTGLFALDALAPAGFGLMCIPPDRDGGDTHPSVYAAAADLCAARRAFLIVDAPAAWQDAVAAGKAGEIDPAIFGMSVEGARSAAVYFPRVVIPDPLANFADRVQPASGTIAGIYAGFDTTNGVWKAPAGMDAVLSRVTGLAAPVDDALNGQLNPLGINCLRKFPVGGVVIWGARTLRGADMLADEYRYIPVRRLASYIDLSLTVSLQWTAFEPNGEATWAQIRLSITSFLESLYKQGAFAGTTASQAFFVSCDASTTTPADMEAGHINAIIGFAPAQPAEFLVLTLQLSARSTQD